jgi:uncharacterized cupredoxin-like copper-binding protein
LIRNRTIMRTAAATLLLLVFGHALAADVAPTMDWSRAVEVTVRLVDERFVPDKLVFRHGVPYRLRLENTGHHMHEFTAPEFLKAVTVRNPEVLAEAKNELLLQPGEHKELYFFAPSPGRFELTCADHDWDGMTGSITVE